MRAPVPIAALALVAGAAGCSSERPTPAKLGALVFADTSLSMPAGQGCADCHAESTAFHGMRLHCTQYPRVSQESHPSKLANRLLADKYRYYFRPRRQTVNRH